MAGAEGEVALRLPRFWSRGPAHLAACGALLLASAVLAWDVVGLLPPVTAFASPVLRGPLVGLVVFTSIWVVAVVVFVGSLRRTAHRVR